MKKFTDVRCNVSPELKTKIKLCAIAENTSVSKWLLNLIEERVYAILSNDKNIEKHASVQAVPLTSNTNKVRLGEKVVHLDGFSKPSKILGTQLSLFPKAAFLCGRKIGKVSKENMKEIEDCLREQLSLNTESEGR